MDGSVEQRGGIAVQDEDGNVSLLSFKSPRSLNIGCGEFYAPGWVNVDLPGTGHQLDEEGSILDLPFDDATFDRAYVGHVLEHVRVDQVAIALDELHRVLKPGARLCVVGPDYVRAVEYKFNRQVVKGVIDGPVGSPHLWVSTGDAASLALHLHGWEHVVEVPIRSLKDDDWPVVSFIGWQFAVLATRPYVRFPVRTAD